MARKAGFTVVRHQPITGARGKKTCIGRHNIGFAHMNKSKRRSFKKYRGQGR